MRSALALIALTTAAHADGFALAPVDPCYADIFTPAIVEADTVAQADLYAMNCGRIPTVAQMVALDQNYTPGDPDMHWEQPPLLPPAQVPLGATIGYLTAAMLALMAVKGMKNGKF